MLGDRLCTMAPLTQWPAAEQAAVAAFCRAWWDVAPAFPLCEWFTQLGTVIPYDIERRLDELADRGDEPDIYFLCDILFDDRPHARLATWCAAPARDEWLRRKLAEATSEDLARELEITLDQRRERRARQGES